MKFFVLFFALFALASALPQWGFEGIALDQDQDGYGKYQTSRQNGRWEGSFGHQDYEQRGPGYGSQRQRVRIGSQW